MIFATLAFFILSPAIETPATIQNPAFQSEPFLTGLSMSRLQGGRGGTVLLLEDHMHAATSEVMNSRDNPQRISISRRPATVRGTRFDLTLNPLTVTLFELDLRP